MIYVLYCTTVCRNYGEYYDDTDYRTYIIEKKPTISKEVVGIFDSMKLAEKAKKEFDENFDSDQADCDEWDTHIEEYEVVMHKIIEKELK